MLQGKNKGLEVQNWVENGSSGDAGSLLVF